MQQEISLFPLADFEAGFTADDWETPDDVACRMAGLVRPSDLRILEPAAGSGQIAKYLPSGSFCCEIKSNRVALGQKKAPQCHWKQYDFFTLAIELIRLNEKNEARYGCDVIITNPPFSKAIEFIEQGLTLLNRDNSNARLLYLLPIDFCSSIKRGMAFKALDCHVYHEYRIMNRIAYIRGGKSVKGRQIYDAVFDIRPGRKPGAISFL